MTGATTVRLSRTKGFGLVVRREFSVFNDLSNKLKGEFNRHAMFPFVSPSNLCGIVVTFFWLILVIFIEKPRLR